MKKLFLIAFIISLVAYFGEEYISQLFDDYVRHLKSERFTLEKRIQKVYEWKRKTKETMENIGLASFSFCLIFVLSFVITKIIKNKNSG